MTRALLFAYALMLVFDAAVLAAFLWLIEFRHWSGWWIVVAILIMSGSAISIRKEASHD